MSVRGGGGGGSIIERRALFISTGPNTHKDCNLWDLCSVSMSVCACVLLCVYVFLGTFLMDGAATMMDGWYSSPSVNYFGTTNH